MGIVDQLETIEVDEQQRHAQAAAPRTLQGIGQPLADQRAVGQAGELIVGGTTRQFILGLLAFGDVTHGDHQQPFVAVPELGDGGFERKETAVLAIAHDLVAPGHAPLGFLACDKPAQQFDMPLPEMGWQQEVHRHAEQLFLLVAKY